MATFTEFYCDPVNGSNLNGGSGNPASEASPVLTSTAGNWDGTSVFTCTDSPTLTAGMVGKFASIYVTAGATVAVYIARINAIDNSAKTVTLDTTAKAGAVPGSQSGTMTCKIGGAWQGPNGAVAFPLQGINGMANAVDAAVDPVRINLRNNAIYSLTASIANVASVASCQLSGYSVNPGDQGKAIFDAGGGTFAVLAVGSGMVVTDVIVQNNTGSSATGITVTALGTILERCVARNIGAAGFSQSGAYSILIECEAYNCNTSNTSQLGGFVVSVTGPQLWYCYAHDNVGSNNSGFTSALGFVFLSCQFCISESNGQYGFATTASGSQLTNCDAYNNGSDGLNFSSASRIHVQNCNFLKNGGWGINGASGKKFGDVINCGFGTGSQANALGNTNALSGIVETGDVIYASGVTPWNAPSTGDFRITLGAAQFAGRGAFTEVGTKSGTVGMPPIGAALYVSSPTPPNPGSTMNKAIGITVSASTELVNITGIFAGESVLLTCTYNVSTNIAGQVYTLYIRDRANGTVLISYTGSFVNSATGVFTFTMQATDTLNTLGPGTFAYSIESPSVAVAQGIMPLQGK